MPVRNNIVITSILLTLSFGSGAVWAQSDKGWKKTPSGIPWYVSSRPSNFRGAEAAMRSYSSRWREPWVSTTKLNKTEGRFRFVTINGGTYVVMSKFKQPALFSMGKKAEEEKFLLFKQAVQKSGCSFAGNTVVKKVNYIPTMMGAKVSCSFT